MVSILFVWKGNILCRFTLTKITGKSAQRETIHPLCINSICTFEINGKYCSIGCYKTDVRIMILMFAKYHFEVIFLRKPRNNRKQHQFNDFRGNFCIYRNGIDIMV